METMLFDAEMWMN